MLFNAFRADHNCVTAPWKLRGATIDRCRDEQSLRPSQILMLPVMSRLCALATWMAPRRRRGRAAQLHPGGDAGRRLVRSAAAHRRLGGRGSPSRTVSCPGPGSSPAVWRAGRPRRGRMWRRWSAVDDDIDDDGKVALLARAANVHALLERCGVRGDANGVLASRPRFCRRRASWSEGSRALERRPAGGPWRGDDRPAGRLDGVC